jgi:hypothetical protein
MKFILLIAGFLLQGYAFSQSDTSTFLIRAQLTKAVPLPPHCGVFAWAITLKFRIFKSDALFKGPKMMALLNMPCPEFKGNGFFETGQHYEIICRYTNNYPYTVINNYKFENLPVFWIDDIRKLTN